MRTAALLSTCDSSDGCWAVPHILWDAHPTIQLLTVTTLVQAWLLWVLWALWQVTLSSRMWEEAFHFIPVIECGILEELTNGKKYYCWFIISVPDTFMFRIVFRNKKRATDSGSAGEKISLWPGAEVSGTSVVSVNPWKEENNCPSTVSEKCPC